jgi:hypothetical protein
VKNETTGGIMYPSRKEAEDLLLEAGKCNPGQWESHSRITAYCAEKIAERSGMDSEKAYILRSREIIPRLRYKSLTVTTANP